MARKETPKDPEKVTRILAAATHEFAVHGYTAAKTDQIAVVAQVSKGLIFHYYGSKQQLYFQTVVAATERIKTEVNPQAFKTPADLVTLVVRSTKYKAEFGRQHPDEMRLMINAYGNVDKLPVKIQGELRELYAQSLQVSQVLIGKVIERLPLRPGVDRETVIQLIMGVYQQIFAEFQAHMAVNPDAETMLDAQWIVDRAKQYMAILENGFVQPE
ncbi:TetR/AcrR family transcriptional regulator [Lactiplantibacillus sp. WILCCON 0030]|uniref:TetR/AcrR family transcriptional regulator n=1 Tax=Lactiplantibacillus brownii TaxID=3069269 RepID=A0ABU1A6V7_9LACO|nr:TetR/AcrR family transcriptional regulator [Lactiplantibacillus brownii]MDQ7936168.1 TetR/AcrR family transcriptional regulator [Lactiplantibacillus brownii]